MYFVDSSKIKHVHLSSSAWSLWEKEDLKETAQGTQEQDEESTRHQEGQCGRCWQKGIVTFLYFVQREYP